MNVDGDTLVLAFYPNARGFAYVIFEGPLSVVDWGICDLLRKEDRMTSCVRRVGGLIGRYRPDYLVLRAVIDDRTMAALMVQAVGEACSIGLGTYPQALPKGNPAVICENRITNQIRDCSNNNKRYSHARGLDAFGEKDLERGAQAYKTVRCCGPGIDIFQSKTLCGRMTVSAVIGNAGTLIVFRVGSRDAESLAPEFRPMEPGALADQEPFTAWLRRGIGHDRIFVEDRLYQPLGTAEAIREQSRQRFGRSRAAIERQRRLPL